MAGAEVDMKESAIPYYPHCYLLEIIVTFSNMYLVITCTLEQNFKFVKAY